MTKKTLFTLLFGLVLGLMIWIFFLKRDNISFSPIPIHRYEIALMEIDSNRVADELYLLYKDFPLFGYGADLTDKHSVQQIFDFITDPRSKDLLDNILEKYPNLNSLESTLGQAFARYNRLFGKNITPSIYTYISYLDYDNRVIFEELSMDTVLVIALDMYLGAENQHYDAVSIPMYMRLRLDKEFIPVDALKAVAHFELERTPHRLNTLLDHMIFHGKVAYFLEQTLPKTDLAVRFGFTPEQMTWAKRNEKILWSYLMGEKLLYEQNPFKFRSFVMESPTIQAFPGSPGRAGHYLGYRIVKKYMENTEQSFPELFAETDSQKILRLSNYRP